MKINEVEALVGITKKNIRFYEEQGLLSPRRNSENGYRDYGQEEVDTLRQIKLLRKLGVPLEEIRQMQTGSRTLGDGMRRHLVTLERERKNLDQAVQFCQALKDREVRLDSLDAGGLRPGDGADGAGGGYLSGPPAGRHPQDPICGPGGGDAAHRVPDGGADRPDAVGRSPSMRRMRLRLPLLVVLVAIPGVVDPGGPCWL